MRSSKAFASQLHELVGVSGITVLASEFAAAIRIHGPRERHAGLRPVQQAARLNFEILDAGFRLERRAFGRQSRNPDQARRGRIAEQHDPIFRLFFAFVKLAFETRSEYCCKCMSISGQIPIGLNTYCLRASMDRCATARLRREPEAGRCVPAGFRRSAAEGSSPLAGGEGAGRALGAASRNRRRRDSAELRRRRSTRLSRTLRYNIKRAAAMGSPIVRSLSGERPRALSSGHGRAPHGNRDQAAARRAHAGDGRRSQNRDRKSQRSARLANAAGDRRRGQGIRRLLSRYRQSGVSSSKTRWRRWRRWGRSRSRSICAIPWSTKSRAARRCSGWCWAMGSSISKRSWRMCGKSCPPVHIYIKPITGRPPVVMPYLDPEIWTMYPAMRGFGSGPVYRVGEEGAAV